MESFQKTVNTVFRTVLCTVVVVVAMAVALCVLSGLFVPKNNQKAFGMTNQEANGIMGEPKNTIYEPFSADEAALRTAQDLLPVFEFHDRWKTITAADATADAEATWTDDLKGFYLDKGVNPADPTGHMSPSDAGDHMNLSGAMKVSSFIGKYLSDAYGLPNQKQDEAYRSWNEAFARYESRIKE